MCKIKIDHYLNSIFFNTTSFESFLKIENEGCIFERDTDYYMSRNDGRLYEFCEDPNKILFFHGFKPGQELDLVIEWMRSKIE